MRRTPARRSRSGGGLSEGSQAAPAPGPSGQTGPEHAAENTVDRAMRWIELLSSEVGPRRPTGRGERLAAELMRDQLRRADVEAHLEEFPGYATFGEPYAAILAAGTLPSLLPGRMRIARSLLALSATTALATEGSLRVMPLSTLLARRRSVNLIATIEPSGEAQRTLCLMSHLDTSRSGLMFHPQFVRHLGRWITAQSLAGVFQGLAEPLVGGRRSGRRALAASRAILTLGLALLIERELRGEDVPGANDNASGCAVAATLAADAAADRLPHTRVVVLMTGCEESGTLGSQAFLRAHDTSGWLFLNFDNVGGDGSVRFLRKEGVISKWNADAGLISVAAEVAARRPELRMAPEESPAGLTYDTSPILARGGRALTISVQDGSIPNLHWPTDTYENVDRDGVARTIEAGRELVRSIDAGAAD